MLTTPGGTPASASSSTKRSARNGVSSAGFSTTVLPQTSAGQSFHDGIAIGKFHGVIAPTTPDRHPHAHHELVAEARSASSGRTGAAPRRPCSSSCRSLPERLRRPRPAPSPSRASSGRSAPPCGRAGARRAGTGSRRARGAGTRRQSSNAAFAAATARSTSAAPERGNEASVSPVAGTNESNVAPPSAPTHSPPMKFSRVGAAAIAPDLS